MKASRSFVKNERGFLTLDFLFAFVLVMGFSGLLFALSMTLTMVEVTQYVTFAAARNYTASHINVSRQTLQARAKFGALANSPALGPLYKNGWFEIADPEQLSADLRIGGPEFFRDYDQSDSSSFYGVGTVFRAKMLDFKIPFYGSTTNSEDDHGFETFIASYLGQEPATEYCMDFFTNAGTRMPAILDALEKAGRDVSSIRAAAEKGYVGVVDNGC